MRPAVFIPVMFCLSVSRVGVADEWPMYRKDPGRTAAISSEMPNELSLCWTRQLPPLQPAFRNPRLQFDAGYEPVSADGLVLVASSQNDSVTAFDAVTGARRWVFRTNGPVRCAPAIWQDRVCFGSDDGFLYCTSLKTGELLWKHRAAPSDRRLLGNGRLISVWPVRGGPVVADGHVYFAAGVWPFEGVFVYAMDVESGDVLWCNDRMGYLFGQQPHNTQAIGGLAPQGYLVIDEDELIVPCSTAFPARLNRSNGELIEFELPGPGRLPGGWFSQLDMDTARALRRGKITFDDLINRQQHEGKEQVAKGGVTGLSRQIRTGETTWSFDDGFQGLQGTIHSMIVSGGRLFVTTRDGTLACFGQLPESTRESKRWPSQADTFTCDPVAVERAEKLVSLAGTSHGVAVLIGVANGELLFALAQHSNFQIVAFEDNAAIVDELRSKLESSQIAASHVALIQVPDLSAFELPPFFATLIATERASWPTFPSPLALRPLQALRPFGGVAAMGSNLQLGPEHRDMISASEPGTFRVDSRDSETVIRRVGPLPGATQYPGNWQASQDALVRFPLGVLWFDDSVAHFKRSPQPRFYDGVMVSRPKNWLLDRFDGNNKIDYPLLPPVLSDIYTGRVFAEDEHRELRDALPESDLSKLEPSQYRPPRQSDPMKPKQPNAGLRINPLTGIEEQRTFPKTYGCDGGVDYGLMYTLRSGTPAYYDKTLESGTVFLSGPRSGCTNSIIPSGGLLNVPYFYEGCTCSYPLPAALSLVPMPQRFEQWSSWGKMEIKPNSIRRLGLNFGAPGDRMTRDGTLWLDYPSVGGPSPDVDVVHEPAEASFRYRHSMWMHREDLRPWVTASAAEGLHRIFINDLVPGRYMVNLFFSEGKEVGPGQRVQNMHVQGEQVLANFDVRSEAGEAMKGVVITREQVEVDVEGTFELRMSASVGTTRISGIELLRQSESQ